MRLNFVERRLFCGGALQLARGHTRSLQSSGSDRLICCQSCSVVLWRMTPLSEHLAPASRRVVLHQMRRHNDVCSDVFSRFWRPTEHKWTLAFWPFTSWSTCTCNGQISNWALWSCRYRWWKIELALFDASSFARTYWSFPFRIICFQVDTRSKIKRRSCDVYMRSASM